jgi:Ssp1 endopeptidase immunity protein Rap1a
VPEGFLLEDGNFLLRECKETLTATYQACSAAGSGMHCLGFIDGLVDMNNIYKATVLKGSSRGLICLPKDKHLTTGQLARVVVEYLEHNPGSFTSRLPHSPPSPSAKLSVRSRRVREEHESRETSADMPC